ncbi:MAG: MFS transporter, partial [Acidimicrobiia bacterium]|nr:MFS transporter [Acidimicrobiia bacterium]
MTPLSTEAAAGGILSGPYRPAAIAIFTTVALAAFEGMAVAAALPQVAADLGGVALLPWVITSFLLASSVTTVVSGPFIDGIGVARIFRVAVIVFSVTGTAAAFAPSMPVMIALRVAQGAAGGLLISSGLAAVALVYPQQLVGRAYAGNSTVWGVMSVASPGLTAAMLTYLNWRWIFLINLPLGVLALIAGHKNLPGPADDSPVVADYTGAALVAGLTTALLFALDALGPLTVVWLAVSGFLAALYLRH